MADNNPKYEPIYTGDWGQIKQKQIKGKLNTKHHKIGKKSSIVLQKVNSPSPHLIETKKGATKGKSRNLTQ